MAETGFHAVPCTHQHPMVDLSNLKNIFLLPSFYTSAVAKHINTGQWVGKETTPHESKQRLTTLGRSFSRERRPFWRMVIARTSRLTVGAYRYSPSPLPLLFATYVRSLLACVIRAFWSVFQYVFTVYLFPSTQNDPFVFRHATWFCTCPNISLTLLY